MPEVIVRVPEAAAHSGLTEDAIRKAIKRGKLPARSVNGYHNRPEYWILLSDLEAYAARGAK